MAELYKPKFAAFHITYVCDNKCPYCYIGEKNRGKHPPLDKLKKIVKKLKEADIEKILLVGGDPCKYPHLKELVSFIKKQNIKLNIISNTLKFDDLDFFIKNIDEFQATIVGNEKEHDLEVRNKGAYKRLIENIKKINKNGKSVVIVLSVHKKNYNSIYSIVKNLYENIKIKELCIQRIIPQGRNKLNLEYSLNKEDVPEVFEQLDRIKKEFELKILFEDPFPLCIVPKEYQYLSQKPCVWGFTHFSLSFEGGISRCGVDSSYSLGNILKEDLIRIWNKSPTLISFRKRDWLPKKCQECKLLEKCGGGCSLSKITNKDHDCDILCPYY